MSAPLFYPNSGERQNQFSMQEITSNVPVMSDAAFSEWRAFIYQLTGIYFQDNKKYLLESRLQKRLNYLGITNYDKYLDYVRFGSDRVKELKYLYEAITINETYFFRNQPQLDALVATVIPEILATPGRLNKNKIRIWSAACSSGEEAYSVSIIFNELIKPRYPNLEIEIVGTDINYAVVETATTGIYRDYSVRNTPPYYLKKYFIREDSQYILKPQIKASVNFKVANLYDDVFMRQMVGYDIIFCANVLIYFDLKSKIKVISQMYSSLNKGGYLFIGYSETLHGVSKAFKLVSFPKTIGYKKE